MHTEGAPVEENNSNRKLEDQFIHDFPENEDAKKILAEREEAAQKKPEPETWILGEPEDEAEKTEENKEPSIAGRALRFAGEKARGAYDHLNGRAREAVGRLYEGVKIDKVDRLHFYASERIFRVQEQFFGDPTIKLRRLEKDIADDEKFIAENSASRERLSAHSSDILKSDLGEKILSEGERAKERVRVNSGEAQFVRTREIEMKERQTSFKAEQARQAMHVMERIDEQLAPFERRAAPYESKKMELEKEIASRREVYAALQKDLQKSFEDAGNIDPESPTYHSYIRVGDEIRKNLAVIEKETKKCEAILAKNNTKLESIQARMKPWKDRRRVYEGMIFSELPKEQLEKMEKSRAEAEVREKEEADTDAKEKEVGKTDEEKQREAWEKVKEGTKEQENMREGFIKDQLDELRRFFELSKNLTPEQQEAEYERFREVLEKNADEVLAGEQQEEASAQADERQAYEEAGIPEQIAWGPEGTAEKEAFAPEFYVEIWNKTVKGFPISSAQFLKMIEKRPSNRFEVEELDENCRNYFREAYRTKHNKRFDWRYHEALEEGIKKMHSELFMHNI